MKCLIVLSALLATTIARPGVLLAPQVATLAGPLTLTKLVPGAPIGLDGRVVDTPEVALAKAEHAAAHINERISLANEAVKSADLIEYTGPVIANSLEPVAIATKLLPGAPIGLDGRVVDTPEVALAKAEHAAARINQNIEQAAEQAAKSGSLGLPVVLSTYSAPIIQKVLL
ncbi:uncharacterized protein LOC143427328 [Xylocopa sonorina]|uniref:uncharacterized protein LOC143427328 n=1 Tax=Xylocopa sonorina TaxID=1818115 RepID=UPI00403AEC07